MREIRVGIGASSFGTADSAPLDTLLAHGITVVPNPFGRRLSEPEIERYLVGEKLDGLLAGLEPLTRGVLERARPRLKAVARIGIGITNVDVGACEELGIRFSYTPDAPTEAVTEMTVAALLCLARDLDEMNRALHAGEWPKRISRSLKELTVLVVGFGRIGRAVAAQLAALGCQVIVSDPFLTDTDVAFPRVDLADGLAAADAVTLHASGTTAILGERELALARPGLMLLNSARAELVDEAALENALASGQVAKAWFDAFWEEPYKGPLARFPQVLMTPHVATYTRRCRLSMETEAVRNLLHDLDVAGAGR